MVGLHAHMKKSQKPNRSRVTLHSQYSMPIAARSLQPDGPLMAAMQVRLDNPQHA